MNESTRDVAMIPDSLQEPFRAALAAAADAWTRDLGDRLLSLVLFGSVARRQVGPQELFDETDARRAVRNLEFVAGLCQRLLSESA